MAKALNIPGADRTSLWFGDKFDGLIQGVLDKLVLHSTETNKRWGCPGYGGGATAPTVTINPWRGYQKRWQHFQANESARALLNPSSTSVSENKDRVAQVEIIGYSDIKLGKAAGCYLPDLADDELQYIADTIAWYRDEWGIRLVPPPTWPWYQGSSEKAFADARMTSTEYDRFAGVLAHLHVSGNAHRDVAINHTKLLALAGGEDDDMPITDKVVPSKMLGDNEPAVAIPRALDLIMRWTLEARDNAIQARKIAEAQALKGDALTEDEVKAALKEALAETVEIDATVTVKPQGVTR